LLPTQGYEPNAAKKARLFLDCFRHLLGSWDGKAKDANDMFQVGDTEILNVVLKAINDIQPEVGWIKNMVQLPKQSKPAEALNPRQNGWHTNEHDTKSVAGAAVVKGTRLRYSFPIPSLTSARNHIYSSYDPPDDLEANIAGQAVNETIVNSGNHKILTAQNNVTALGYKCLVPQRLKTGVPRIRIKEARWAQRSFPLCVL
jgi:hypothetical protein